MYKVNTNELRCMSEQVIKDLIRKQLKLKKTKEDFVKVTYLKSIYTKISEILQQNKIPFKILQFTFQCDSDDENPRFESELVDDLNFKEDEAHMLLQDDRVYIMLRLADYVKLNDLVFKYNMDNKLPFHNNSQVQCGFFRV